MRKTFVAFGAVVIFLAGAAAAQTGFYPIEEMRIFAEGDLEVDIDLQSVMLQVAAAAIQEENADLANMVAGLDRVRVQVGSASGADFSAIEDAFANAIADLKASGWIKMLAVQEDEEQVHLFALESGGVISGLTILVSDGVEEIVVANLVGAIDPVALGKLIANLDEMPDFDMFMNSDD